MITANKIPIVPTIFPDKTSQIWKLPSSLRNAYDVNVIWDFEEERELIDLLSLRRLLYSQPMSLYMPFLPYARQDKTVSNYRTFNLEMFADVLNGMRLSEVAAMDVHNPRKTKRLIKNFRNVAPTDFHMTVANTVDPDVIVFPDEGAAKRYTTGDCPVVIMQKNRNQSTGKIMNMFLSQSHAAILFLKKRALILDDICDGGATFIMCAQALRVENPDLQIHLAVTHGIFSRGVGVLEAQGIQIHCHRFLKIERGEK